MNQYLAEDFIKFLQVADDYLSKRCELIIIGGAAASLAYGVNRTTSDIDLATKIPEDFIAALASAKIKSGFSIPISHVGVFEPPYNFEKRIAILQNPTFRKLCLYVPERHDLALMKMVRGYENDIQAIIEISQNYPLSFDILIDRFMNEMTQVIGNPKIIRLNFLLMVEALFGHEQMQEAKRISESWGALIDGNQI